jgi:DNA-binding SARP family transcriptional activator
METWVLGPGFDIGIAGGVMPDASLATLRRQEPGESQRVEIGLWLLSGFELRDDRETIVVPASAQRLIAFLAMRDRPAHRLYVAGKLWIDRSEEHANACLRTALWRLRQLNADIVTTTSTHLMLSDRVAVDVRVAVARATRILGGIGLDRDDIVELSRCGELLPDWYDDWVMIERERLRHLVIHALERLSADATAAGHYAEATDSALAAVEYDPLRESAHRLVMEAQLGDGNASDAIRQYRLFARLLKGRLGLEPSPRMQMLVAGLPIW